MSTSVSVSRPNCVICFSPIKDGVLTPCCNVTCCEACLRAWLSTDTSCPQCRRSPLNISQAIPINRVLERLNIGSEVYPPLPTSPTSAAGEAVPLREGGTGVVGAPDALFTGAPVERAWTERKCFYIFGAAFLGYAFITLLLMIVWKSGTKSPWDALSGLMIFIFVSFLLVALLTMLCSKCCRRADHKFFQHCCGELIITAALALAGLVIVGASMNGVQVKYVDAVFKERFNDYAEEFSIPLETHTEELAGRRKAMTALFVVLVPCVVALAAVVLGYYLRVFDDAHHAFAFLSLGAVLPTLIAVCGLTVCFSLGLIVYRAPSLYAPIFRNSIPTILTVSLITLGFLLIFLLMMCCWNRCGRDFVIEWKRFAVVLVLASLAALVAVVFQLSTAYRKSNSAVPKACEDWSMLNKVCNYTGSAEHRHSPRPVILLSDLSINPSTSSTNTNRALPTPSIPIPIPSINSTTPSIPIPSINSTHSTLTSPDGSSPYPPHPYPVGNPVAYTRECTELGENLYHYKYVSEKYYVNPPRTDDPLCFDLAPLAADTHDQAVRGAEAIRKASAWLSAFGVFVFAGILLVAWCSGLCYYMKRREGAVIN